MLKHMLHCEGCPCPFALFIVKVILYPSQLLPTCDLDYPLMAGQMALIQYVLTIVLSALHHMNIYRHHMTEVVSIEREKAMDSGGEL